MSERERVRETDRQTHRQRQKQRHTDREGERETEQTDRNRLTKQKEKTRIRHFSVLLRSVHRWNPKPRYHSPNS